MSNWLESVVSSLCQSLSCCQKSGNWNISLNSGQLVNRAVYCWFDLCQLFSLCIHGSSWCGFLLTALCSWVIVVKNLFSVSTRPKPVKNIKVWGKNQPKTSPESALGRRWSKTKRPAKVAGLFNWAEWSGRIWFEQKSSNWWDLRRRHTSWGSVGSLTWWVNIIYVSKILNWVTM